MAQNIDCRVLESMSIGGGGEIIIDNDLIILGDLEIDHVKLNQMSCLADPTVTGIITSNNKIDVDVFGLPVTSNAISTPQSFQAHSAYLSRVRCVNGAGTGDFTGLVTTGGLDVSTGDALIQNDLQVNGVIHNSTIEDCTLENNTFPIMTRAAIIYTQASSVIGIPVSPRGPITAGPDFFVVGNIYYHTGGGLSIDPDNGTITNITNRLKEGFLTGACSVTSSGTGAQTSIEVLIDGASSIFGALKYVTKPANNSTVSMNLNSYIALNPGSTLNIQLILNGNLFNTPDTYFTFAEFPYTNPFSSFVPVV